jgi:hypothetical protein
MRLASSLAADRAATCKSSAGRRGIWKLSARGLGTRSVLETVGAEGWLCDGCWRAGRLYLSGTTLEEDDADEGGGSVGDGSGECWVCWIFCLIVCC